MSIISNRKGWIQEQIGTHCIVGDGAHAKIKRQNSGVKYLTSKNFKNGRLDLSKLDYISEESYQKYFKEDSKALTKPQPNDVLFSIIGTIGEPYLVQNGDKYGLSSSVSIIRTSKLKIYPNYLYYWIRGQIFQDALYGIKGGVAQSYVSLEMIKSLPLYYPSLSTQHKIASILSAYDDLIENNTRRIKILESMAQTIYQEWFVKFRFPGHKQVKMVESDLGLIPEGWEVKNLKDVCNLVMGQSPKSEFYNETGEGLPFHQGVSNFGARFPTDKIYCTVLNRIAEAGDILFSVRAPVGRINIANKKIIIGRGLCGIRSNTDNQSFIFQQLKEKFSEEDLMGGGTIFKSVTKKDMQEIKLIIPSTDILQKFESIVNPVFRNLELLISKNDNLRKTRDLLLPKLISGQIDVENLDIDTGEIAA